MELLIIGREYWQWYFSVYERTKWMDGTVKGTKSKALVREPSFFYGLAFSVKMLHGSCSYTIVQDGETMSRHDMSRPVRVLKIESDTNTLAPQDVEARTHCEAGPLSDGASESAYGADFAQPTLEELSCLNKVGGLIVGHEELASAVYHGEGCALGVPRGIDGLVASEKPDLVRQLGQFLDRFGNAARLGHDSQCLKRHEIQSAFCQFSCIRQPHDV